jgi:hypothetical protein
VVRQWVGRGGGGQGRAGKVGRWAELHHLHPQQGTCGEAPRQHGQRASPDSALPLALPHAVCKLGGREEQQAQADAAHDQENAVGGAQLQCKQHQSSSWVLSAHWFGRGLGWPWAASSNSCGSALTSPAVTFSLL